MKTHFWLLELLQLGYAVLVLDINASNMSSCRRLWKCRTTLHNTPHSGNLVRVLRMTVQNHYIT